MICSLKRPTNKINNKNFRVSYVIVKIGTSLGYKLVGTWINPVNCRSLVSTGLLIETKIKSMRHISTLFFCLLLLSTAVYAQDSSNLKIQGLKILSRQLPITTPNTEPVIIRIRCGYSNSYAMPLIVIDGIVAKKNELKNMDPNDIENITVLKGSEGTTLFGSRGVSGVIVITTKNKRTIKIKDAVTGEPLPSATVDLFYGKHNKNSRRSLSDSLGQVIINDIKPGTNYELQVSSIGYKTYKASVNASILKKGYSVSLRRNYADLQEVVVTSGRSITCRDLTYAVERTIACGNSGVVVISDKSKVVTDVEKGVKIYPNPVLRFQQVNIQFENTKAEKIILKLFSLDGKSIEMKEYISMKGLNKINYSIDSRLASGAYSIQLIDENNKLIKADKLIIQ